MSEQPADASSPQKKKSGVIKIGAIGCGGLLLIIIILGVIFRPSPEERAAERRREDSLEALKPREEPKEESQAATETVVAEPKKRTGTSRSTVLAVFEKAGFEFTKGQPSKGEDNYVGQADSIPGAVVQLIGPEEDLISASSVTMVYNNDAANEVALLIPVAMAKLFNEKAALWVGEQLSKDYTSDFDRSREFEDIKYKVSYTKMDGFGMITLSIEAE